MSYNYSNMKAAQEQAIRQQREPSDVPLLHYLQQNLDSLQAMLDSLHHIREDVRLNASLTADLCAFFHEPQPPPETFDLFKIVVLYKYGQGQNWIPNKQHRQYLYVYAPIPTATSIASPLGPAFIITIPAVTLPNMWNKFDLPDQSTVTLDTTATANQMIIFTRETNVNI
jgi:hypothetical protein